MWTLSCTQEPCAPGYEADGEGYCVPLSGSSPPQCADDIGAPPGGGLPPLFDLADSAIVICGQEEADRLGRFVAGAGDIDGDGRQDLLVGADRAEGLEGQAFAGAVHLLLARDLPDWGGVHIGAATAVWHGEGEGDLAGHAASSAGDLDGDGQADLMVSAYHADHEGVEQGRVYLLRGDSSTGVLDQQADWLVGGPGDDHRLGHSLALAGDVDGDGLSDVVFGACCGSPPGPGRVWLLPGAELGSPGEVELAAPLWLGEVDNDQAGFKVGSVGDVDGDGLDDFTVAASLQGADELKGAGSVFLLLGGSVDYEADGLLADSDVVLRGTGERAQFGYDLGPAGDLDGDGLADLVVGANQSSEHTLHAGQAYIYLATTLSPGEHGTDEADLRFTSSDEGQLLGSSVEGGMDLDGDGLPELVLGAPGLAPPTLEELTPDQVPEGLDRPGDVFLFWGSGLSTGNYQVADADVRLAGSELNEHAGVRVTSPGDVDGDGRDDLLVGTERGQMSQGRAYLLLGLSP